MPSPSTIGKSNARPVRATRLAVLPQPVFWGVWVAVLSVAVLALGFFVASTPDFTSGEFTIDQELSRDHVGILTALAMVIDRAFSPVGGFTMIALVCLFLLLVRKSPVNAIAFGGVAATGWLSSQFFKVLVERQRPNPALLFDPLAPETGSNSFPSGHVALAVGLAWAFWFLLRNGRWAKVAALLALVVPVVVALSRIYVGVHYPTDVAASFLAASAGVLVFAGVWNRYQGAVLPRIPLLARFGPLTAATSTHPNS
ncbi:phosphatase PAP2 family protein [Arthrobacter sp. LAPM80]|uniref:phosphatase PAP2 family protein n=1 Tax=Arthrobacter sp. LAPM80 TaxID=3141788 RepID=UPI00398AA521